VEIPQLSVVHLHKGVPFTHEVAGSILVGTKNGFLGTPNLFTWPKNGKLEIILHQGLNASNFLVIWEGKSLILMISIYNMFIQRGFEAFGFTDRVEKQQENIFKISIIFAKHREIPLFAINISPFLMCSHQRLDKRRSE